MDGTHRFGFPGTDTHKNGATTPRSPTDQSIVLCRGVLIPHGDNLIARGWFAWNQLEERLISTVIVQLEESGPAGLVHLAAPVRARRFDKYEIVIPGHALVRIQLEATQARGRRLGPDLGSPICPTCFAVGWMDCDEVEHRRVFPELFSNTPKEQVTRDLAQSPPVISDVTPAICRTRAVEISYPSAWIGDQFYRHTRREQTRIVVVGLGRSAYDEVIVRPFDAAGVLGDRTPIGCDRLLSDFDRINPPIALVEPAPAGGAPRRYGFVRDVGWDPGE